MKQFKVEDVYIQSYKHDGSLHRTWDKSRIIYENDEVFVVMNNGTQVTEGNGRSWIAKEPAIYYLFKKRWFNVIAIKEDEGIGYYCNLSSPSINDGEAIKNIDYDLDIKFAPNGEFDILDVNEYLRRKKLMNYPEVIDCKMEDEIEYLIDIHEQGIRPFDDITNEYFFKNYRAI